MWKWLLLLISSLPKPKWHPRASIKGKNEGAKKKTRQRRRESNQRTIPHLRLSEAIYLRKWGRFWWEGVCWYVCPPDPSVISHIKGSTTRQLAYRRERGLQEFGGFSEICSLSPELSEATGERKSKSKKLNDIFDPMNIWHSCCSRLCARIRSSLYCRPCCYFFCLRGLHNANHQLSDMIF